MQHAACIGLMIVVATACAAGPSLPAAAQPASIVRQAVAFGKQGTTSQLSADTTADRASDDASDEQPRSPDLCALVTTDEMAAIIGPLTSGAEALKGPAGETLACTYTGRQGQHVTFMGESPRNWGVVTGVSQMNKTDEPVSGYGREALFGPANDPSVYALSILTDRAVLHIAVKGAADKVQALTIAEAVAAQALPRL